MAHRRDSGSRQQGRGSIPGSGGAGPAGEMRPSHPSSTVGRVEKDSARPDESEMNQVIHVNLRYRVGLVTFR